MNHWFDDLTKQLAADKLSRRSVFSAAAATLAAAAVGTGWPRALFADARNTGAAQAAPNVPPSKPVAPQTVKYGPCTATSSAAAITHELTSTVNSSGKTVVLHSTRALGLKGMTLDKTVLIDGKQQFQLNTQATSAGAVTTLTVGDAFGYNGAQLKSSDGGHTISGTIEGRAIVPIKGGAKLQFVDGQPFNQKQAPGAFEALKAVFVQHSKDLQLCGSQMSNAKAASASGDRHDQRPILTAMGAFIAAVTGTETATAQTPPYTGYPLSAGKPLQGTSQQDAFRPACAACGNSCDPGAFTGFLDVLACIFSWGLDCQKLFSLTTDQETCIEKCNVSAPCHGQLCGLPPGQSVSILPSCNVGDFCIQGKVTGNQYCCPIGFPNVCGSACCGEASLCVSQGFSGGYITCCPIEKICGTKTQAVDQDFSWYVGTCCPPLQVCAESVAVSGQPGGQRVCCGPLQIKNGKCCSGQWCGNTCCPAHPYAQCKGEICEELCLTGQYTTNGKCCSTGVACGNTCCQAGCADAKTSACKSTPKCTNGSQLCTSKMAANPNVTEQVCCPKNVTCFNGGCCPAGTTACAHVNTGKWGCWPAAQCQVYAPPK
jgi:hypothetical protein